MARPLYLSLKHKIRRRLPSKPTRWVSSKDRLDTMLSRAFRPKTEEMRRVFHKLDADGDGKITGTELRRRLEALRGEDMGEEAEKMVEAADLDGDGGIDFKEFMEVHRKDGGVRAAEVQRAFWIMDLDGDGRIGAGDLHGVMERLGERCSRRECERMVETVDTNGAGLVDMDDFMALMTRTMELVHV